MSPCLLPHRLFLNPSAFFADPLQRQGSSLNRALTYQHVFQFDIPMDKPLAMQKADSLHHIQSYLQTRLQGQPSLGRQKSPDVSGAQLLDPTETSSCEQLNDLRWHKGQSSEREVQEEQAVQDAKQHEALCRLQLVSGTTSISEQQFKD